MKKLLPNSNQLPKFPSKKIWKNDEKVINERRVQLMEYLNNLSKKADLIHYEYACSFLKIEGYLRDYLNDLVVRSDNESPQNCNATKGTKRKSILDSLRISTNHRQGTKNSDDREDNEFDFMDNSESGDESLNRIPLKLAKSTVEFKTKKIDNSTKLYLNKKQLSSSMVKVSTPTGGCGGDQNILEAEIDLLTLYKKLRLSEEEIVLTFFKNINIKEQSKDHWIRDFEDFYFKIRPKFQSKLIRLLLEGDMTINIQGLFYFMSEIETSFVSACSTIQLISKLIDFQKNIYADTFIKELVRIDPNNMRKYNFEGFLEKENSEGYRQSALHILQIYVDRRIAFKNTIGTIAGNLKHAEAFENQRYNVAPSIKNESEEQIISVIVKDSKLQQEVLNQIRAKNIVNQQFSTSSAPNMNPQLKKQDSSRKLNSTFLIAKKRNSQLSNNFLQSNQNTHTQSNDSLSNPSDLNDQAGNSSISRTPNKSEDFTEILIKKFSLLKYEQLIKDIANSQVKVNNQVSNILEYMHISKQNKNCDLFIKISDTLIPRQPILFKLTNIQDFQVHAALMKSLKSSSHSIRTLKYIDHSSQLLEMSKDTSKVQVMMQLSAYSSPDNSSEKYLFYIVSVNSQMSSDSKVEDSKKICQFLIILIGQDRYAILCLKKSRNLEQRQAAGGIKSMIESFSKDKQSKTSKIEAFLFIKKGSIVPSSQNYNERLTNITDNNFADRTLTQEDLKASGVINLTDEYLNSSMNENEDKLIQALKSSLTDMLTGQGDENISDNQQQQQPIQNQTQAQMQLSQLQQIALKNKQNSNSMSSLSPIKGTGQQDKLVTGLIEKLVDIVCSIQGQSDNISQV
ncbi:px domain containing protein [Stylonychia lemnae]|uniref:Px domain containing protein n=1 Tax=Stylonychia lemnae TaxID=5949 RepID=A0A078ACH2_STYLE|nr:px domain containing protein [Stylonychia lemnae]|eukprot:CDW79950.1 px domain containing protein [Stylonychia lemnae]